MMKSSMEDAARRAVNAEEKFLAYCEETHRFTRADAEKIMRVFIKARVLKIDWRVGQWEIKHGAFLEERTMKNALEMEG